MKIEDTIGLMCSDDYRDRLKAEYLQLIIRLKGAQRYFNNMDEKLSIEGGHILQQISAMKEYRSALRRRLADNDIFADTLDAVSGEE